MELSARTIKLLVALLSADDFITVQHLASHLGASRRTIFREMNDIGHFLQEYELAVISKSGIGIKLQGYEENKASLQLFLTAHQHGFVDKKERQQLLILEVLKQKTLQKLFYYADKLKVSEATISNDFDQITPWFEAHHLLIRRTPGVGIELLGEEEDYRKAVTAILYEGLQDQAYASVSEDDLIHEMFFEHQGVLSLLDQMILHRVLRVLKAHRTELLLFKYAQSSYIGLLIHLTIAIDRILKQEEIEHNSDIFKLVETDPSFEQARQMAILLEEEFHILIPQSEVAFIAMHIKGAKLRTIQDMENQEDAQERMHLITLIYRMIDVFDPEDKYHLKRDEEFIQGLYAHLRPTLVRLHHRLPIHNPLLGQLKELYANVYAKACRIGDLFVDIYGYPLPDAEIGFLAMHFGASMERQKNNALIDHVVSVGVICSSGIGTSSLLSARINSMFQSKVAIAALSVQEALDHEDEFDIFVSTFSIKEMKRPILIVNPLLGSQDILALEHLLQSVPMSKKQGLQKPVKSFLHQLQELQALATTMIQILNNFCVISVDANLTKCQIMELIGFRIGTSKEQGSLIYKDIIQREELGTTMYEPYHFMLIHAETAGVDSPQFQLLVPNIGRFVQEELNHIHYLLVMLIPKQSTTMEKQVMSVLSRRVLENDAYKDALESGDEIRIRKHIESMLEEHLEDCLLEHQQERR